MGTYLVSQIDLNPAKLEKRDIESALKSIKPSTTQEEQRHLDQFMLNRKNPEGQKKEETESKDKNSFYSEARQLLCAGIFLILFLVGVAFLWFVITEDESYGERLHTKIRTGTLFNE